MPTLGGSGPWDVDPRGWERARRSVAREMAAEGWRTYARKYDRVLHRRALKLWYRQ